jgi:hypothetical protein
MRSGPIQCVNCGCNYEQHKKRETLREEKRISALIPLKVDGGESTSRVFVIDSNGRPITLLEVNNNKTGKRYWKKMFQAVRALTEDTYTGADDAIERLKKLRYDYRTRPKERPEVSKNIEIWAQTVIAIEMKDHYCVDNIRYARYSDRSATRRYFKQKRDGCCGSFDIIKRCPFDWFRKYRIGCNYGH